MSLYLRRWLLLIDAIWIPMQTLVDDLATCIIHLMELLHNALLNDGKLS